MAKITDLTDVRLNQAQLDQRPPVINPPVPPSVPYLKVLYYNDIGRYWNFNVRYIVFCLKRRLVSASTVLASGINSLLQWGELFAIDGAETIYYARSNPTTTIGTYDGNNTIIKVAGPGAFVSRDSQQVIGAQKTFAGGAIVGNNLTVAGDFRAASFVLDCGKYVGTPDTVAAPSAPTVVAGLYSATISWSGTTTLSDLKYIIEAAEVGPYAGPGASSSNASLATWTAVALKTKNDTTAVIDGLRPGVVYKFRVNILDVTGNIVQGAASSAVAILNH